MRKIWWINKDVPLFKNSGSCIARTEKHWDDDKPHMEVKPCPECVAINYAGIDVEHANNGCKDGWVIA